MDKNGIASVEDDRFVTRVNYPWVDPSILHSPHEFNAVQADSTETFEQLDQVLNLLILYLSVFSWLLDVHHLWIEDASV